MNFEEWLNDTYIGLSTPVQLAELAFNAGFKAAKNEEDRAMLDAIVTGTGVLKDGKRIDPKDLYVAPTQEPSEDCKNGGKCGVGGHCEDCHWPITPSQEPVATVVRNVYGRISADFLDEDLQHGAKLFTTPPDAAAQIEFQKREHIEMQKYTLQLEEQIAKLEAERDKWKFIAGSFAAQESREQALLVQVAELKSEIESESQRGGSDIEIKMVDMLNDQNQRLEHALENCRLLAARHRKEEWALLILGFCAEGGVIGSATRSQATPQSSQMITMERMISERDDRIAELEATVRRIKEEDAKCKSPAK